MTWLKACPADLAAGECRGVVVGGVDVALFATAEGCFATSNICTHQHALLSEGWFEDGQIECPLHQARFDVRTGASDGSMTDVDLKTYAVRIEGGEILVDLDLPG